MKLGAPDYLGKPLSSPDELRLTIRRVLDKGRAKRENALLREEQIGDSTAGYGRRRSEDDRRARTRPQGRAHQCDGSADR